MALPDKLVARVLIRSARHCCICRRFSPLQIQVHHIVERSKGGTDDEDNLIPICISCHSMVHANPQMTQAFTVQELKGSRDEVFDMVAKGKLPVQPQITSGEMQVLSATLLQALKTENKDTKLSDDAAQLLLAAACEQADIRVENDGRHFQVFIGGQHWMLDARDQAQFPDAIFELARKGFMELGKREATITERGIAHVHELVGTTASYTVKKVKCMKCSLHFSILSWKPEAHRAGELHCPECGQSEGFFLVWAQQKFGFIFQEIPGHALPWDFGGFPR